MEIICRHAVLSDAEKIAEIWRKGYRYAHKNILSADGLDDMTEDKKFQKRIGEFIRNFDTQTNIYLVAEYNGEVIGYVEGGEVKSSECAADKELHRLYIDTNYLKRGVGKKLILEFANAIKGQGAKSFGLICFSENKDAIEFYKHLGGKIILERPSGKSCEYKMGTFIEFDTNLTKHPKDL